MMASTWERAVAVQDLSDEVAWVLVWGLVSQWVDEISGTAQEEEQAVWDLSRMRGFEYGDRTSQLSEDKRR